MLDGITSQYGFLYQKYIFIMRAISHASMDRFFTYEGIDDIDIDTFDESDGLSMVSISTSKYIQVKSGTVSLNCWAKVLGNWLLIDDCLNKDVALVCENALEFDVNDEKTIDAVYDYFEQGKDKKRSAVARKVYDKILLNKGENNAKEIIKELSGKCIVEVSSMDSTVNDLCQIIIKTYCTDIKIYERAKQARCERFVEYLLAEIDAAIKNKKKYTLGLQRLIEISGTVKNEISDNRYTVNTSEIKKRKQKEAETLVKNSALREIRQLKLVNNSTEFITREVVNELLYRDFRDVYANDGIEVSNIEDIAFTNYQDALFDLGDNPAAKEVFKRTTAKEIHSSIMQNSPIYRKGCYVYLTGDDIETDKQISWGKEDEE